MANALTSNASTEKLGRWLGQLSDTKKLKLALKKLEKADIAGESRAEVFKNAFSCVAYGSMAEAMLALKYYEGISKTQPQEQEENVVELSFWQIRWAQLNGKMDRQLIAMVEKIAAKLSLEQKKAFFAKVTLLTSHNLMHTVFNLRFFEAHKALVQQDPESTAWSKDEADMGVKTLQSRLASITQRRSNQSKTLAKFNAGLKELVKVQKQTVEAVAP